MKERHIDRSNNVKTSDGFMEDNSVSLKCVKVSVSADHLPPKYQFFDVQRNAARYTIFSDSTLFNGGFV